MYSGIQQTERFSFIDECTCNLNELTPLEKELFLKVYRKLYRMNSKIHDDFNILCNKFVYVVRQSGLDRSKFNNIFS